MESIAAVACLPRILRAWKVLAKLAVQSWDDENHQVAVAHGGMTANDFTDGNQAKLYINNIYSSVSPEADDNVCDDRFQGMLLGLLAAFPYDPSGDYVARTRKITNNLFLEVDDQMIECMARDRLANQEWGFVQNMASQWLRVWISARKIQSTYRKYREHRRNCRLRITIPRLVALLNECKGRE